MSKLGRFVTGAGAESPHEGKDSSNTEGGNTGDQPEREEPSNKSLELPIEIQPTTQTNEVLATAVKPGHTDRFATQYQTKELRRQFLANPDPYRLHSIASSNASMVQPPSNASMVQPPHSDGVLGKDSQIESVENISDVPRAVTSRPLLEKGAPTTKGFGGRSKDAFGPSLDVSRQCLTEDRHILLVGRDISFDSEAGLLCIAAHEVLSSLKDQAKGYSWWCVSEDRAPTAEALGQALHGLGSSRNLIWWKRKYEPRDTNWSPHILHESRELLKQRLAASNSWLVEIVDVPVGRRLRYRDYEKYSRFVFHVPWHDYWLSEIFGHDCDPESYKNLRPLLDEAVNQSEHEFRLFARLSQLAPSLRELNTGNDGILDELRNIVRSNIEASRTITNVDDLLNRHLGTGGFAAQSTNETRAAAFRYEASSVEIGAPLVVKQIMLLVAAFADGIHIHAYDQLCQALLPDAEVPTSLLPSFLREGVFKANERPSATHLQQSSWTWKGLWRLVSDDARQILHITVATEGHKIQLSISEWGETPALRNLIATRYASVWRQTLKRARAELPLLEPDAFEAGLIFILNAEAIEEVAGHSLERRAAAILVGLLKPLPSEGRIGHDQLSGTQRFRTGIDVLTKSGLFSEPLVFAIYDHFVEVSREPGTHALLMSELAANFHVLGIPSERFAHVLRELANCDLGADKRKIVAKALSRDRHWSERRWLWMNAFIPWLDPQSASYEQQQLAYLVWDECLYDEDLSGRDIAYGEVNPDKTIAANIMKGSEVDAQGVVEALAKMNGELWLGASRTPQQRFFDLLHLLRHGAREVDVEQYPDLDGLLNGIIITDVVQRLISQEREVDTALAKLVSGHRDVFELLKAAMFAEWRFQLFGVTNDGLQDVDKTRLRNVIRWIANRLGIEERIKLASDWEFQGKLYQKFARICMECNARELRSIYLSKRDRLSRMATLLLKHT